MSTHFEEAFKNMPTPAFIIESSTGRLLSCNNNFEAFFKKFDATPAQTWDTLCYNSASSPDWKTLNKTIQSGEISRCESLIQVGSNNINMQLKLQHLGSSVLVCVYNTDHMDIFSAENPLLKFALTESSAGLWIWETDTDLVSCSKSIAILLGCTPDQTPKSTPEWHTRVHPDDVKRLGTLVNENIARQQDYYEAEYRIRRNDQTYLWVKERGKAYTKNASGQIQKVIGFVVDISHQKSLEEHLRNQATIDELTGLLTKAAALTHFKKQLGLAKRQYTPLTMAKIHLDASNQLQALSVEERDIAVQTSSQYIYQQIREADVLARVEEDKLLLLLPNTSVRDAGILLDNMVNTTEAKQQTLQEASISSTSFCIGIATFPEDGESIEELAFSANQSLERNINQFHSA